LAQWGTVDKRTVFAYDVNNQKNEKGAEVLVFVIVIPPAAVPNGYSAIFATRGSAVIIKGFTLKSNSFFQSAKSLEKRRREKNIAGPIVV
ncbi:MAG: hypothetical protein RSC82_08045, partial [Oscillospiraceae bacterium]